jgi:predicted RNase H-like nuclease (RuvC/YqgF family)
MANIIGDEDLGNNVIWDKAIAMHEHFIKSKFNVDNEHVWDCIDRFYKDYQKHQMFLNRITNFMSKDDNTRDIVIDAIKNLMSIDLDGETMQHIIEMLNMEDQMLSQLGHDLIVENQSLKHRLNVISEDEKALRRFVIHDEVITHLNNIEIACDLNDSESLNWKNHNKK